MNSEKLLGLAAIVMSLCTLVVFVYQTNLIKKQQYASVYPHLQISNYASGSTNYKFVLSNLGVGPAMLKSININDDKTEIFNDLDPYLISRLSSSDSIPYNYTNLNPGMLIPAGARIDLIVYKGSDVEASKSLYHILNKEMALALEYESIYGERWSISNRVITPTKVR